MDYIYSISVARELLSYRILKLVEILVGVSPAVFKCSFAMCYPIFEEIKISDTVYDAPRLLELEPSVANTY